MSSTTITCTMKQQCQKQQKVQIKLEIFAFMPDNTWILLYKKLTNLLTKLFLSVWLINTAHSSTGFYYMNMYLWGN